jgi:hypothetical protein
MALTREEVAHIADLAHLETSELVMAPGYGYCGWPSGIDDAYATFPASTLTFHYCLLQRQFPALLSTSLRIPSGSELLKSVRRSILR